MREKEKEKKKVQKVQKVMRPILKSKLISIDCLRDGGEVTSNSVKGSRNYFPREVN